MTTNMSFLNLILNASFVVQLVMFSLLVASVASWSIIFTKQKLIKKIKAASDSFESNFWAGGDLTALYQTSNKNNDNDLGMAAIFRSGFQAFNRISTKPSVAKDKVVEECSRAMRVAQMREVDKLEQSLATLASIGSISPYVGLFGTVWGIINSFQGLSDATQATINAVAPGISEALVATALGLFAAIPAVVAYNRFASESDSQLQQSSIFGEELASILYRQTVKEKN